MAFDITLEPAKSEFLIIPGEKYIRTFNITNNSSETIFLSSSLENWQSSNDSGLVSYQNQKPEPSLNFSLQNTDIVLGQTFKMNPKEKKQLVLKISTTKDIPLKDYYYTFFLSQQNFDRSGAKIGSHLIFSTQSEQDSNLKILNFSVNPKIRDIFGKPININSQIINQSRQYNHISGKLTLYRGKNIIKEIKLFPNTILGQHPRAIECEIVSLNKDEAPMPSKCQLQGLLWPGIYTVTLESNSKVNTQTSTTKFVVFPFSFVLLIIFLFFLYRSLRRR